MRQDISENEFIRLAVTNESVFRYEAYRIAQLIHDYELDEDDLHKYTTRLMQMSGICDNCHGSGEDGDPPDAAGDGGWIGDCRKCNGTGRKAIDEH